MGALASFGFELHSVKGNPTAAFYSPFLRFWELMAGSILAWMKLYKSEMFAGLADRLAPYLSKVLLRDSSKVNGIRFCCNILSVLGLISILIGIFALSNKHFPGSKALYPVLGAVLMIAAGKDAFLNRYLLSNRVMVWFGLISYPLYIWHWPFLSFAWIVGGEMPELKVRIGCVVLAIVMSAATYYFVVPRLRWGRFGGYKAAGLLSAMVVVGITGYSIERHDGYAIRLDDPEQPMIESFSRIFYADSLRCISEIPDWKKLSDGFNLCRFQRESGENTIAIIGDSHANHLYPGLTALAGENEGIAVFPAGGALPLIGLQNGITPDRDPIGARYGHLLSEGFEYILSHKNISKVVLSHHPVASWQHVFDRENPENRDFNSILKDGFARTYEALTKADKEIYVVLDNPRFKNEAYSKCKSSVVLRPVSIPLFLSSKNANACSVKQSETAGREARDNWDHISRVMSAGYDNIHFIDLEQVFCENGTCSMLDNEGSILYMDTNHFNMNGSRYAAPFIYKNIRE